jgi:DNA polymerase III delta subunit
MITTLSGSNNYLIDIELKKILSDFENQQGKLAIEQIDASESDVQSINEAIIGLSFLSPIRLIVLKSGSSNKQFIDSIDQTLPQVPSTNQVVLVEPSIDKRLSYYKTLKSLTEFKSFEPLDFGQTARWIESLVKDRGGRISSNSSRYLVELIGLDQMRISNEIDKLLTYNSEIDRETIDRLVEPVAQTSIFQLLDAVFNSGPKDILRIYDDQKTQKVEPQQIIAMLTWQIHIIAMIKAAGDLSASEIARKTKISPYVVSKSMSMAKKLSKADIKQITNNLLELDVKLKNKTVDIDDALLQLLLSVND